LILFLDFDGVLHPQTAGENRLFCGLHLLWDILRARPDVEVVFSTSWREVYGPEVMLDFVTANGGEDLINRFIGSNPSLIQEPGAYIAGRVHKREAECLAWLSANQRKSSRWLALDDIAYWFSLHCPNLYLVVRQTGLTEADAAIIIERLA